VRSPISQKITRLRHGQVPAKRQKYIPASCTAHKMRRTHGYLARRSNHPYPTKSETSRGLSSFFHHLVTHSSLDSQCPWIFVSLFPCFFRKEKTAGCYDLYIETRAPVVTPRRSAVPHACSQAVLAMTCDKRLFKISNQTSVFVHCLPFFIGRLG